MREQDHARRPIEYAAWSDRVSAERWTNKEQAIAFAAFIAGWYARTREDDDTFWQERKGSAMKTEKEIRDRLEFLRDCVPADTQPSEKREREDVYERAYLSALRWVLGE